MAEKTNGTPSVFGTIPLNSRQFLKTVFGKFLVNEKNIETHLQEDLNKIGRKMENIRQPDLATAYMNFAAALNVEASDPEAAGRLYKASLTSSRLALVSAADAVLRVQALMVGAACVIQQMAIGQVSRKDTKCNVKAWLNEVNGDAMNDVRDIIKEQIRGVTFLGGWQKLARRVSTKEKPDFIIMMELCRVFLATFRCFKNPASLNKSMNIVISRSDETSILGSDDRAKSPYVVSAGFLLMDIADEILFMQRIYDGDPNYHKRQLVYLVEMLEFVVEQLEIEDGSRWRMWAFKTKAAILATVKRQRFVTCLALRDYQSPEGVKWPMTVNEGEEIEIIEVGFDDGTVKVRRAKVENGHSPFYFGHVPSDCIDIEKAETVYEEMMTAIKGKDQGADSNMKGF